jgi:NADH:ubiquinone oxidoreductase subunit 2 (subunit N)
MQIHKLKINSFILFLNSVLTVLPEYFIATSILSMAIFFSVSQKMHVQTKKIKVNLFSLGTTHLNYLAVLIIFFYCFLCIKQNFLLLSDFVNFNNTIHNDFISILSKLIIGIASIVYLLLIQQYLTDQKLNNFEYYIIVLTAILGLCLLCCSDDLLTAYLAIELQGLSFYILASFKKTSNYSVESGIKYFILGSFSTVIFLLGINLIYGISGSMSILDFKDLFSWTFSSNSYFIGQDTYNYAHIFKSLFFFNVASLVFEDLIVDYDSYKLKYDMVYDLFTIFPKKVVNIIPIGKDIILFYDILSEILIERMQKDANVLIEQNFEQTKLIDLLPFIDEEQKFTNVSFYSRQSEELLMLKGESLFIIKNSLLELGLFIILISLFFKLALSPFHLWSPDIYEGSPSSTTFFFTIVSKLSIFIFLLKICYISFYSLITDWQLNLLIVALLSIIIGSVAGLKQRKFKSLLAYSSISNMGLILVSFSSGNFEGIKAIFYYFIIYILSGLAMWSIVLILRLKRKNSFEKHNKDLGDFSLLKESNVVLSYAAVITLFTIAGIPPTVGFLAKINIFLSLTTASLYFVALVSIVSTVISTFYYIRILKIIFFENLLIGKLFHSINSKNIIVYNILFFLLVFLFISPGLISLLSYKTTLFLNKSFY